MSGVRSAGQTSIREVSVPLDTTESSSLLFSGAVPSDSDTSDAESDDDTSVAGDQDAAIAPLQQQILGLQHQIQHLQNQLLSTSLRSNVGLLPTTGVNGAALNGNVFGAGGLAPSGLAHMGLGAPSLGDPYGLNSGSRGLAGHGGLARHRSIAPPPHGSHGRRGNNIVYFDNGSEPDPLGSKTARSRKAGAQCLEYKRVDQVWDSQIHNYKLQDTNEGTNNANYDGFLFHVRRTFDWEGKYKTTIVDIKSKLLREALMEVMGSIKGVSLVEETPKLDPNMLFLYVHLQPPMTIRAWR